MPPHIDAEDDTPDAHGHAALLIVESLIHVLIAKKVLTVRDAVEVVEVAADVTVDMQSADGATTRHLRRSLGLIHQIGISLRRGDTTN